MQATVPLGSFTAGFIHRWSPLSMPFKVAFLKNINRIKCMTV